MAAPRPSTSAPDDSAAATDFSFTWPGQQVDSFCLVATLLSHTRPFTVKPHHSENVSKLCERATHSFHLFLLQIESTASTMTRRMSVWLLLAAILVQVRRRVELFSFVVASREPSNQVALARAKHVAQGGSLSWR